MTKRSACTMFAVSFLAAAPLLAQSSAASQQACAPLRPAEVEAALGAKLDRPLAGMAVPFAKGAAHLPGETAWTCQGSAGGRALTLTYGREPAGPEAVKEAEARLAAPRDRLRSMGYTVRETKLGATTCWTMTPPATHGDAPVTFGTTCGALKGLSYYSVSVSAGSAAELLPAGKVKRLADRAAARLP
jgi:hypothetical protein